MVPVAAFYRESAADDWREVAIVARHASGKLALREVGRPMPGIFLADPADIRLPAVALDGIGLIEVPA